MGSQLQLCSPVGSQLLRKMHKVLVASCLAAAAYAEAEPGYLGYGYGYGYPLGGVSTGLGLHPTGSVYESRSAQGLGKRSAEPGYLGYGLAPYGYAIGGVSTGVGLHPTGAVYESRSAQGLGKRALMLSQDITHRTTGHPLSLPTDTPPAMDAVVSVVLSQDILVLAMDMASVVSAEVLVSTLLGQSMSPDQHRVSAVDTCTRLLLLLCNLLEINNVCYVKKKEKKKKKKKKKKKEKKKKKKKKKS